MKPTARAATKRSNHKGLIFGSSAIAVALVIAIIAAKPGSDSIAPASASSVVAATAVAATPSAAPLSAREANFDFGPISMAAGKVTHRYWVRNDGSAAVLVKRIYTSCMCTTATLVKSGRVIGSYGMPGHGPMPDVNALFASGEAAYLDVVFDPAAHGPAGLGHTERVVSIESDAGRQLQLAFVADVRP
jgi:hypothetical protein